MLDQIVEYLVSQYKPKSILLHGSRARGDHSDKSDYDITLIEPNTTKATSHRFLDYQLDINLVPKDCNIITTGSNIPTWPVQILFDDYDQIGLKIVQRTKQAYKNGPNTLGKDDWNNRKYYAERLINKIDSRGTEPLTRYYYLSEFYMRIIRYWFEKNNLWTVSPYRALPYIREKDKAFAEMLENLWSENYMSAAINLYESLFIDK